MGWFESAKQWLIDHAPPALKTPPLPKLPGSPARVPIPPAPYGVPHSLDQPPFPPLSSWASRAAIFGSFNYEPDPQSDNQEHIHILGDWVQKNIIFVPIPQLRHIPGAETHLKVVGGVPGTAASVAEYGMSFHRLAASQLQGMWGDWERYGLLNRIKTFEGSFSPRYVRGSSTNLSNHCFGTAFDINYEWNTLGAEPAQFGERGTVRELVPLSIKWGFYWGGFYHGRKDGMHFEVAKVMP